MRRGFDSRYLAEVATLLAPSGAQPQAAAPRMPALAPA